MTSKSSRPRERAAARKKLTIDDIVFELSGPTVVARERLYSWVVWQFPRLRSVAWDGNATPGNPDGDDVAGGRFTGHSGAVHAADVTHGWYPALIDDAAGQALIFANIPEPFPNPEAAAKHLDSLPE